MKKVLVLVGSPRKNGNTVTMVNRLKERIKSEEFHIEVEHLYDHEIDACIDCRVCKKDEMVCKIQDGMQVLYPKIEASDYLIFATPIYWFGPSAKTKLVIDRLRPYFANNRLHGKKGALLLPSASGPAECDLTIEQFRRTYFSLGVNFLGAVTSTGYNAGDVEKDIFLNDALDKLIVRLKEA